MNASIDSGHEPNVANIARDVTKLERDKTRAEKPNGLVVWGATDSGGRGGDEQGGYVQQTHRRGSGKVGKLESGVTSGCPKLVY